MELRQLRYFIAVAEERHFGRAAERLHIAQPPLSQQIKRFEAELGEPVLYRTTRSVELAPAGEVLLERGREILAAVDSAIDDARRAARGEYGRLAIGFTGSSTYELLPSLAVALRQELPGVMLDLRGELLTPAQVTQLIDGTLDLGLLRPPVHERDLTTEVLRSEPLIAVEGLGLLAGKRWAEWLTVAVTASFIPFELYELLHQPGPGRALTLALNVAVVAYLAYRRVAAA